MSKLYFRYGAMNCGKTTQLLQVAHNYEEKNKKVIIIKASIDSKGKDKIVSRLGVARKVDMLLEKNEKINIENYENISCILVDEAQFLTPKQIEELSDIVDYLEIPVICYGIRTDFLNELFPGGEKLFAIADIREEINKTCSCGRPSICNIRFTKEWVPVFEGNQVEIDGKDFNYKSMCRKCAKTLRKSLNK